MYRRKKQLSCGRCCSKCVRWQNAQSGYVSGETLVNYDDPTEHLVISTWKTLKDWNIWLADGRRRTLQSKVDEITGAETLYSVYYNG